MIPEIRSETDIFCDFGRFFALLPPPPPPNDPENQNVEKRWKKCLKILSFYRHMCNINVDHMIYGSWNTRCERQKFCHFGPSLPFQPPDNTESKNFKIEKNTWRYYHFTHLHHKWQSFDVWFLGYGVRQTEFSVILDRFSPFYPPMDPENQNSEKMKKIPEDIIILKT